VTTSKEAHDEPTTSPKGVTLGLDTFGDVTEGDDGRPLTHAQTIRNIVDEGILADQVGVDYFGIGEHHTDDFPLSAGDVVLGAIAARTSRIRLGSDGDAVLKCVALFSFIGAEPASDWLSGWAALDDRHFVLTDRSLDDEHLDGRWAALRRRLLPFETSQPGLFAVGDVRSGSTKRVAAIGEGSAAVRVVHDYLAFPR